MIRRTILLAVLVGGVAAAEAGTFEPVRESQVPSGMPYSVTQPRVEDPRLFAGKHIAILASHGVEEAEITFPYEYLVARGARVDIVVPSWTPDGVVAVRYLKPSLWVRATTTFERAMNTKYDLVVITGGAWNAQVVRSDSTALRLIYDNYHRGIPVAAICAGSSVLINAGLARGQRLTGSPVVALDLVNAGARYQNQPLVFGDRLATSRSPDDLPAFVTGIRALLIGR